MPRPERPSALDGAFLDLDRADAPLHVGFCLRLAGAPPSLAALRRHVAARLDRAPVLRRRLVATALAGGALRFEDDLAFCVERHVHAVEVPAPGGSGALRAAAGALLAAPLDPARPLWQLHLVRGLASGFALVGQAHHALLDGRGALALAAALLDDEDDGGGPRAGAPAAWHAAREDPAAAASGVAAGAAEAAGAAVRALAGGVALRALPRPGEAAGALGALRPPAPAPPAAGAPVPAPRRALAFAQVPLAPVRDAARAAGATVTDALLAATALALRSAAPPGTDALRALVPVDLRGAREGLGNRLSFLPVALPLDAPGPAAALARVQALAGAAKAAGRAAPLAALAQAGELLPRPARRALAEAALRAAAPDVVVSSLRGPDSALRLLGRPVLTVVPAVPLLPGHALAIGALSYRGTLGVGVQSDARLLADPTVVAAAIAAALRRLAYQSVSKSSSVASA